MRLILSEQQFMTVSQRVACAAATYDDSVLSGILFDFKRDPAKEFNHNDPVVDLMVVATDGSRMHKYETRITLIPDGEAPGKALIPAGLIAEFRKQYKHSKHGPVLIDTTPEKVTIQAGSYVKVEGDLLQMDYPAYSDLFPTEFKTAVTLFPGSLVQACNLAVMCDDRNNLVILDMQETGMGEAYNTHNDLFPRFSVPVGIEVNGDPLKVAFNANYLKDIAKYVKDPHKIILRSNGPLKPAIIKDTREPELTVLLMPVQSKETDVPKQATAA